MFDKKIIKIYSFTIISALCLALFIRSQFVESFKIPTNSMLPGLFPGDIILVNKLYKKPKIGDIVVYTSNEMPDVLFIKRIIAKGGDIIEVNDGIITINNLKGDYSEKVDENCGIEKIGTHQQNICIGKPAIKDVTATRIKQNAFLLMSDHRKEDDLSRGWHIVAENKIIGKATYVWFSSKSGNFFRPI